MNTDSMAMLQKPPVQFPIDNPYPDYSKMREETPILRVSPMQYVVSEYAAAMELLQSPHISHWGQDPLTQAMLFSGQSAMSKTLFAFAPDSGLPYRKRVLHGLAAKNLKFEGEGMAAHAQNLLRELATRNNIDFMADYAHPYTFQTISRIIGVSDDQIAPFTAIVGDLLKHGGYMRLISYPDYDGSAGPFMEFINQLIADKRANPGDDLTTALAETAAEAKESEQFILNLLILLIYAGHDNMMNFLGNALHALSEQEGAKQALLQNPDQAHECLDELLRIDSPVQFFLLFAKENFVLQGQRIKEGSMITVNIGAANRDPKAFPDPDLIDMDRKPAHLSYGAGAYRCIGARLAQMQGGTGIAEFFRAISDYSIKEPVKWRTHPFVQRGPLELPMQIHWK